jgi:hypothetical protein
MPRPATGTVIEKQTAGGRVFAIRFRAYGRRPYLRLGTAEDGWTREKAEQRLRHVLADVERGIWQPPAAAADPPTEVPTFHRSPRSGWRGRSPSSGRRQWRTTAMRCDTTCCRSSLSICSRR